MTKKRCLSLAENTTPTANKANKQMKHTPCPLLVGCEHIWLSILEFCILRDYDDIVTVTSEDDMSTYLSFLLLCKSVHQIVIGYDEFLLHALIAYLTGRTSTKQAALPSLTFLQSDRGSVILGDISRSFSTERFFRSTNKLRVLCAMESRFTEADHLPYILELLKHFHWGAKQLLKLKQMMSRFPQLYTLTFSCCLIVDLARAMSKEAMHATSALLEGAEFQQLCDLVNKYYHYGDVCNDEGVIHDQCVFLIEELCKVNCHPTEKKLYLAAIRSLDLSLVPEQVKNDTEIIREAIKAANVINIVDMEVWMKNKNIVLEIVSCDGSCLGYVSEELRNDEQVVLAAIKEYAEALKFASARLQNDRLFLMRAMRKNSNVWEKLPDQFTQDRELLSLAVSINGSLLEHASDSYKNDKEIVMTAASNSKGTVVLAYVSPTLRNDRDVVLAAVSNNGANLQFASSELRDDDEIVLAAVRAPIRCKSSSSKSTTSVLKYASRDLRDTKRIVMAAVSVDGRALEYASIWLKDDREVVLAAVDNCPDAISMASDTLRKDLEIMKKSVEKHWDKVMFGDGKQWEDKEFALNALRSPRSTHWFLTTPSTRKLLYDEDIIDVCLLNDSSAIQYASPEHVLKRLKSNKPVALKHVTQVALQNSEIVSEGLAQDGMALAYVPRHWRSHRDMVMRAVKNCGMALEFASKNLCGDEYIVQLAVSNTGVALQFASELLRNDRQIVLTAVRENGLSLKYVSPTLRYDREIVLSAVRSNGMALELASRDQQNDSELVQIAVQRCAHALNFASIELQSNAEIVLAATGVYVRSLPLRVALPKLEDDEQNSSW